MALPLDISSSTAKSFANPAFLDSSTAINFGAGYIDAPLTSSQTPTADATAATNSPGTGAGAVQSTGTAASSSAPLTSYLPIIIVGGFFLLAAVFISVERKKL